MKFSSLSAPEVVKEKTFDVVSDKTSSKWQHFGFNGLYG